MNGRAEDHPGSEASTRGEAIMPLGRAAGLPPPGDAPAGAGEQPGDQIGPYRLRSRIGEGGFGTVWARSSGSR